MPAMADALSLQPIGTPNDIYYYHPNHLGSTSFVTDQNQTITQGFLYAPFGEITTEYNVNFGSSVIPKYSFNAKELDEETAIVSADFGRRMLSGEKLDRSVLKEQLAEISRQKQILLREAGYSPDFLDMGYTCPDCKDTGYIGNEKCHCFKQKIQTYHACT